MSTITTAIAARSGYAKWELKKRFKFVGTRFPSSDRVENPEKSNCCRFALDWAINVWGLLVSFLDDATFLVLHDAK